MISRREKYLAYYRKKCEEQDHCCNDGRWYDNYVLKHLEKGNDKPPIVYDVCLCPTNFGVNL